VGPARAQRQRPIEALHRQIVLAQHDQRGALVVGGIGSVDPAKGLGGGLEIAGTQLRHTTPHRIGELSGRLAVSARLHLPLPALVGRRPQILPADQQDQEHQPRHASTQPRRNQPITSSASTGVSQ